MYDCHKTADRQFVHTVDLLLLTDADDLAVPVFSL